MRKEKDKGFCELTQVEQMRLFKKETGKEPFLQKGDSKKTSEEFWKWQEQKELEEETD